MQLLTNLQQAQLPYGQPSNDSIAGFQVFLEWQCRPLHAVLIFPAFRSSLLHQDLQEFAKNPKTTNLCESQHRNYYRYLKNLNLPLVFAFEIKFDTMGCCLARSHKSSTTPTEMNGFGLSH
jgi:hypothetical protein